MHGFRLVAHLLAVLAVAGLLASPAAAKPLTAFATSGVSMPTDMPCCPNPQKSNDCQDCPLRTMCMLGFAQITPTLATGIPQHLPTRRPFAIFDDFVADSLDGLPPDHPPRILA